LNIYLALAYTLGGIRGKLGRQRAAVSLVSERLVYMKQQLDDFTVATEKWLSETPLPNRQDLGQYMTPLFLRTHLLDQLEIFPGARVLDPGVGTGEFLRQVQMDIDGVELVGWDVDPKVLKAAKVNVPGAILQNRSALDPYDGPLFDFVIGNPPYFEMKPSDEVRARFSPVISGRANIYALFFKSGIEALKPGGVLAYVVPPSMNAGAYFRALRRYITNGNAIEHLKVFSSSDLFQDAQTSVQVIVIRKGKVGRKHQLTLSVAGKPEPIFFENPEKVKRFFANKISLWDLGYEATTGTVVWNQHKYGLGNKEGGKSLPLYYPRNLVNGTIQLKVDDKKPQYLTSSKPKRTLGPAILVNRIIGGVGKGQISSALIPLSKEFYAENHLNVIRARDGVEQKVPLKKVHEFIKSPETLNAARLITGNTQLSATEWNFMIPFPLS
jgi:adenine-specific DNA-methyltransferase